MISKKFFNQWVRRMSGVARRDSNITIIQLNDRKGIVVMNLKNGKTAISKCHPDDRKANYNFDLGLAIAYARLLGQDIPEVDNRIRLSSLKAGTYFLYMGKEYGYTGFANDMDDCIVLKDPENHTVGITCTFSPYALVTPIEE